MVRSRECQKPWWFFFKEQMLFSLIVEAINGNNKALVDVMGQINYVQLEIEKLHKKIQ